MATSNSLYKQQGGQQEISHKENHQKDFSCIFVCEVMAINYSQGGFFFFFLDCGQL